MKFAPMGNALTFPVEELVFGSECQVIQEEMTGVTDRPLWSVYGDDIIVPVEWYDTLVEYLSALGFIVNKDKSFSTGFFRESCGKEYFHGKDVSPLYFKVDWDGLPNPITANQFITICDLLQRLDNPFHALASYREKLIEYVEQAHFIRNVHRKEKRGKRVVTVKRKVKERIILPFTPFRSEPPFIYGSPKRSKLSSHHQVSVFCTRLRTYKPKRKYPYGDLLAYKEWLADAEFCAPSGESRREKAPDWDFEHPPEMYLENGWAEVPSDYPYEYSDSASMFI